MGAQTVVTARIDAEIKEAAAKILAAKGLSVSAAIRLLLARIVAEKTLPFDIETPNAETRAAMAEMEEGGGAPFAGVGDLMADLNAED
jgi:DNA-damage-inducible protein J